MELYSSINYKTDSSNRCFSSFNFELRCLFGVFVSLSQLICDFCFSLTLICLGPPLVGHLVFVFFSWGFLCFTHHCDCYFLCQLTNLTVISVFTPLPASSGMTPFTCRSPRSASTSFAFLIIIDNPTALVCRVTERSPRLVSLRWWLPVCNP